MTKLTHQQIIGLKWLGQLRAHRRFAMKIGATETIKHVDQQMKDQKDYLSRLGLMSPDGDLDKECALIVHKSFVRNSIQLDDILKEKKTDV